MRVTIFTNDNSVIVEGYKNVVDCSLLDERISVIQWYGASGEIEFHNNSHIDNDVKGNEVITDFAPFQYLVDAWEVEARKDAA